jgi:hypothetical protein
MKTQVKVESFNVEATSESRLFYIDSCTELKSNCARYNYMNTITHNFSLNTLIKYQETTKPRWIELVNKASNQSFL